MSRYDGAMRYLFLTVLLVLAAEPSLPLEAQSNPLPTNDKPLTVLMIGNSFAGNAAEYLDEITEAGGRQITIGLAITAGAPLDRHATRAKLALDQPDEPLSHPYPAKYLPGYPTPTNGTLPDPGDDGTVGGESKVSLRDALSYRTWDVVSIQQASYKSFKPETYEPYATELIALIRQTNPAARVLVHQTWAYRIDSPRLARWKMSQQQMHEQLTAAYNDLAVRHNLEQVPVGDAFALARKQPMWTYRIDETYDRQNPVPGQIPDQAGSLTVGHYWRDDPSTGEAKFRIDAFHANRAGRYLAGCVWYEVLFGEEADVTQVHNYKPRRGVSEPQAQSLRTIAAKAVDQERAHRH